MNRKLLILLIATLILGGCGSVSDTRPEVIRKGEYYLEHGVTAYGNSDYVTATDFFNKALAQYRSIDDTHGILLGHINLAETAMATGNTRAVLNQLDEAEKVAHRMNPPLYLKRLILLRAQVYWREGKSEQVMKLISPLLPAFNDEDEPDTRPDLITLTAITLRTDIAFSNIDTEPKNARRWLEHLRNSLRKNGDTTPLHDARLSRFEAQLAYREGNVQQALSLLDEALNSYREAAVRPAIAATLTETARLYMRQKAWQQAEERLARALYIRVWIMDRVGSREVLYLLAAVYDETGKTEKAQLSRRYAESVTIDRSTWSQLNSELLH